MDRLKYHDYFEEGHFYHVYNRTINKELCFKVPRNYDYFLGRIKKYLLVYVDVYAYCLLPTHFHLLIRVKDSVTAEILEKQFKNLLSGYTLAYNKEYERNGSLFQKSFKRINVTTDEYLWLLMHYIHHNPIHHGHTDNFTDWKYSSYNAIISNGPTSISRTEVIQLWNGLENFIRFHQENKDYHKINKLLVE